MGGRVIFGDLLVDLCLLSTPEKLRANKNTFKNVESFFFPPVLLMMMERLFISLNTLCVWGVYS